MDDYLEEDTLDYKVEPFWTPMKKVGALWATAVVGSFAYQFTNKGLKLSQKVVQARVSAQALTVAALMAAAAITALEPHKEGNYVDVIPAPKKKDGTQ